MLHNSITSDRSNLEPEDALCESRTKQQLFQCNLDELIRLAPCLSNWLHRVYPIRYEISSIYISTSIKSIVYHGYELIS
jgi:hypothetical protein